MEPCFKDERCLVLNDPEADPELRDPFGGLGCNAAGYAECRFCGFGQYKNIACPIADDLLKKEGKFAVVITLVLSATIEEFNTGDIRESMTQALALTLQIEENAILLAASATSLRLEATITSDRQEDATAHASVLTAYNSTAAWSELLSREVVGIEPLVVTRLDPPASLTVSAKASPLGSIAMLVVALVTSARPTA